MTVKLKDKLHRVCALSVLALTLTAAEARADFYIAPSMGVGVSRQQIDTKALGGPGRLRDTLRGGSVSAGIALGHRTQIAGRAVDLELQLRASAAARYHAGPRSYDISQQQIGVAAYTTVHQSGGFRAQIGVGAGARRLDITVREGAATRRDVDREPYGMLALRGVWEMDRGTSGFAELRYSAHPTPRRASQGANIEHQTDQVALHFGVQMDLGDQ